ncbi:MAG: MmcQ/YjbR family DNA-binding protein [Ilumatobacteraceae bacterium]
MASDPEATLDRLRTMCLALAEVNERLSHGSPSFFVRGTRVLCSFHSDGIHGEHGMSLWAPAPTGVQEQLVDDEPERFYRPPYVGGRGWVGVRLDRDVDWAEIDGIIRDAYRLVAPKSLARELPAR